jgi:hypothetical protein
MEKELLVVDVETAFPDAAKCRHRSVHRVPLDDGCRACGERGFMGIRILARATVAPVRERGSKHSDWNASNCRSGRSLCGRRVGKLRILALRAVCLRRVAPRGGAPIEIDNRYYNT